MEQQKLPNVTIALVLSIISFLCCCFGGVPGILLSGIALLLISQDERRYQQNPEAYSNYSTLKTTKIVAIIGLIIGILYVVYTWYSISQMGGWSGYMEKVQEMMEQFE